MEIRIEEHPDIIRIINAVLNSGGIVEVKNESYNKNGVNLTVVEIRRSLKNPKKEKRLY